MYAVISTGGKQYRVSEGSVLRVEKLEGGRRERRVRPGAAGRAGRQRQDRLAVPERRQSGRTVQSHGKGDKVRIVKFRRRKHYLRQGTHRQPYTELKVTSIVG